LRAASSVEQSRGRTITDVRDAVVRLGLREVKHIALGVAGGALFDPGTGADPTAVQRFLQLRNRALLTALGASWYDLQHHRRSHDVLFVASMFSDVGLAIGWRAAARIDTSAIAPSVLEAAIDSVRVRLGVSTQLAWRLPSRSVELCQHRHSNGAVPGLPELPILRLTAALVELRVARRPSPRALAVARAACDDLALPAHGLRAFATAIEEQAAVVRRNYGGGWETPTWRTGR
jgi:HD-like signal output (HDOD) protein